MSRINQALVPELNRLWQLYASSASRLSFDAWLQRHPLHQVATIKPMAWAVRVACKELQRGR